MKHSRTANCWRLVGFCQSSYTRLQFRLPNWEHVSRNFMNCRWMGQKHSSSTLRQTMVNSAIQASRRRCLSV